MLFDLTCREFANFHQQSLPFSKQTILVGKNGSGKSKILEGIFLLSNGVPPKDRSFGDFVREGSDFFRLDLVIKQGLIPQTYSLVYSGKRCEYRLQGEKITRAKYSEEQKFRSILFTPLEMNIFYLSPQLRRNFLDSTLLLSHQSAQSVIRDYEGALKSRNALLKSIRDKGESVDLLDHWDQIYSEKAMNLASLRRNFLNSISFSPESIASLLGKSLLIEWRTRSDLDTCRDARDVITLLKGSRERDIITGHTSIGPHHDDFGFFVHTHSGEVEGCQYLSRGENKTLLLLLKEQQIIYTAKHRSNKTIILLFDDIFAELDVLHIESITRLYEGFHSVFTTQHEFLIPEYLARNSYIHHI